MHIPQRYKINTTSFHNYWKKGAGVQLLQQLGFTPDIKKAESFIPYLFEYDAVADKVVHELYNKIGFAKAHGQLKLFMEQQPIDATAEIIFKEFFNTIDFNPPWLDPDKIDKGIELSQRSGIPGLMVLRNYCLMGGYESAAINKPLIYTGALKKGAAKRLTETTIFWVNITRTGAFKKNGAGLWHVISTRMIHAFSRVNILQKTDWDSGQWGVPLNTWDMLATQLGFSLVFLNGLKRMGFRPTREEVDGLFHLWKYIGFLLGIPLHLLPENERQAIEALYYWTMTQSRGDEDSIALAKALVAETVESGFPKTVLARKMMQQTHLFFNYYLLGGYSCHLLGIPEPWLKAPGRFFLWRIKTLEKKAKDPVERKKIIEQGANRQQHALDIYLKYKMS